MNYRSYIISSEWRDKHKDFLKRSHYRCAFFPFIKVGKKARYNVHHMNYENLGEEQPVLIRGALVLVLLANLVRLG